MLMIACDTVLPGLFYHYITERGENRQEIFRVHFWTSCVTHKCMHMSSHTHKHIHIRLKARLLHCGLHTLSVLPDLLLLRFHLSTQSLHPLLIHSLSLCEQYLVYMTERNDNVTGLYWKKHLKLKCVGKNLSHFLQSTYVIPMLALVVLYFLHYISLYLCMLSTKRQ